MRWFATVASRLRHTPGQRALRVSSRLNANWSRCARSYASGREHFHDGTHAFTMSILLPGKNVPLKGVTGCICQQMTVNYHCVASFERVQQVGAQLKTPLGSASAASASSAWHCLAHSRAAAALCPQHQTTLAAYVVIIEYTGPHALACPGCAEFVRGGASGTQAELPGSSDN